MTVGSLFSGIGGLELGLERAGMRTIWQAESDEFCRAVLRKHWPNIPRFTDVRDIRAGVVRTPDLVCGGFPCQPVSLAGKQQAQNDERWLWPEFARVIRIVRPKYVLVENVPGLLVQGMGDVLGDLARMGFDATWGSLPAAAVGAPHLRHRIFLVAHCDGQRIKGLWQGQVSRFPEFSWSENVRRAEDLRGRPDLPEPLIRRKSNGVARRMDACGNAVVPQVAEWIGRRILEAEEAS